MAGDCDGGTDGVFVETVAEVTAAKPEAVFAVHCGESVLGGEGIKIVEGMGEGGGVDDFIGIDGAVLIEGDEVGRFAGDALELIHVVGNGDGAGIGIPVGAHKVPCGPELFVLGELVGVGMEGDGVVLIAPGGEAAGFLGGGVLKEGEGLIGVGGNDGVVKLVLGTVGEVEGDGVVGISGDALNGGVGAGREGEGFPHSVDIGAGTARDVFPLGAVMKAEEAVVFEEMEVGLGGEFAELSDGGGPDRGAHRVEVAFAEAFAEVTLHTILVEGFAFEVAGLQVGVSDFGKAPEVAEEGEVFGFGEVGGGWEEPGEAFAAITVAGGAVVVTEGHGAVGELDLQLAQDFRELRVIAMIHHNITGVDGGAGVRTVRYPEGAGMTTEAIVFLKELDLVLTAQEPGGGGTGDPAADDRDALSFRAGVHALGLRVKR